MGAKRARPPTDGPLRVGIIGAGLGGLACACALQQSEASATITVFEQQKSIDDGDGGEIELRRAGPSVLNELLGSADAWSRLRAESNSPRRWSVPIRSVRRCLAAELARSGGAMQYGVEVARLVQEEASFADGTPPAESQRPTHGELADGTVTGAFDFVVDARGFLGRRSLTSPSRRATSSRSTADGADRERLGANRFHGMPSCAVRGYRASDAHAAIGDATVARCCNDRGGLVGTIGSILLGVRRDRHGGDDALRGGAALGRMLGECAARGRNHRPSVESAPSGSSSAVLLLRTEAQPASQHSCASSHQWQVLSATVLGFALLLACGCSSYSWPRGCWFKGGK